MLIFLLLAAKFQNTNCLLFDRKLRALEREERGEEITPNSGL
jgi:hypothetical protein